MQKQINWKNQEIKIKLYQFQNILQANIQIRCKIQTIDDLVKIKMINLKSILQKVQQNSHKPGRRILFFIIALLPNNQYKNIFQKSIRCLTQSFSIQYIYKNIDIIAFLCKDQIPKQFYNHLQSFHKNQKLAGVLHGSILQLSNQEQQTNSKNSFIIITGGSRGIGKQISKCLSKMGKNLIITTRKIGSNIRQFASQLQKQYTVKILLLQLDLQFSQSCQKFSQQISNLGLQIEGIVHNGGVGTTTCLEQAHLCQPQQTLLKVNSLGPIILHDMLTKNKVLNKECKITIISSVGAIRGFSEMNQIDIVSKAILEPWAQQLSRQGWSVNIIYPGATDTDMFQKSTTNKLKQQNILEQFEKFLPKGFIINPQQIAQTVCLSLNAIYRKPFNINRFMASCGMFIDFKSLPNVQKNK